MIKTPIMDFVTALEQQEIMRCFMPGHKGVAPRFTEQARRLVWYAADITESDGADDLYAMVRDPDAPKGIIAESEEIAASLFGATATCYSTQGSTLGIQAMVYLAKQRGNTILAGRGAHLSFVRACILLGMDVIWLAPDRLEGSGFSAAVTAEMVQAALAVHPEAVAVYLTSPDYVGTTVDVVEIAAVCRQVGVPFLLDNAHGAYLGWGRQSSHHPIAAGVTLCCDSAHKTLPVLTGGGYLHLGVDAPWEKRDLKRAMAMFGSTSPSYLLLASLDCCNRYLAEHAQDEFAALFQRIATLKQMLWQAGVAVLPNQEDVAKLTIDATSLGMTGEQVGAFLRARGIFPEWEQARYVVLLLSPAHTDAEWMQLTQTLLSLARCKVDRCEQPPTGWQYRLPEQVIPLSEMSGRQTEWISVEQAEGRIAAECIFCYPPGVAWVVPGERMDASVGKILKNTGKKNLAVLK